MERSPVSSTPLRSLFQFLLPDSRSALVPVLTSLGDELRSGSVNQRNPFFPPKCLSVLITAGARKLGHAALTPYRDSFSTAWAQNIQEGQVQGYRDGGLKFFRWIVKDARESYSLTHEFWQPVRCYIHFTSVLKHVSQPPCSLYPSNWTSSNPICSYMNDGTVKLVGYESIATLHLPVSNFSVMA